MTIARNTSRPTSPYTTTWRTGSTTMNSLAPTLRTRNLRLSFRFATDSTSYSNLSRTWRSSSPSSTCRIIFSSWTKWTASGSIELRSSMPDSCLRKIILITSRCTTSTCYLSTKTLDTSIQLMARSMLQRPVCIRSTIMWVQRNCFQFVSHLFAHFQPTFIGGILLLKNEDFQRVNGMSNKYWGWGLEDDEFYVRIKDAGMKLHRPQNISTGTADTFNHIHDRAHRRRDTAKCYNQKEETRRRDTKTGLDTIKYTIRDRKELAVDGIKVTILNVNLECDKSSTPWCDCSEASKDPAKSKAKKGLW